MQQQTSAPIPKHVYLSKDLSSYDTMPAHDQQTQVAVTRNVAVTVLEVTNDMVFYRVVNDSWLHWCTVERFWELYK